MIAADYAKPGPPSGILGKRRRRLICRAVIDHDDGVWLQTLRPDTVETSADQMRSVVDWDNDVQYGRLSFYIHQISTRTFPLAHCAADCRAGNRIFDAFYCWARR